MRFPSQNGRPLFALMAGMLCALGVAGNASKSAASIFLPDSAVAARLREASERVDLAVSRHSSAAKQSSSQVASQTKRRRAAKNEDGIDCQAACAEGTPLNSPSTSAPAGSPSTVPQALLQSTSATLDDPRVVGWRRDVHRVGLPEAMPRSLLRPPRA